MSKIKRKFKEEGSEIRREWRKHYERRIYNLFFSKWEIEGASDEEARFIKNRLYNSGKISAFEKDGKVIFVDSAPNEFNIYDSPLFATPVQLRGASFIPNRRLRTYAISNESPEESIPEIVLGFALPSHESYKSLFEMKIEEIVDLEMLKRTNRFGCKVPFLAETTPENRGAVLDVVSKVLNDEIVIDISSNEMNAINGLQTNIPYLLDKIEIQRKECWNEILTILGIDNSGSRKAERELVDEVNSNNVEISQYSQILFDEVTRFFDKVNEYFGTEFALVDTTPKADSFHDEPQNEEANEND